MTVIITISIFKQCLKMLNFTHLLHNKFKNMITGDNDFLMGNYTLMRKNIICI